MRAGARLIDSELAQVPAFKGLDGKFDQNAYNAVLQQRGLAQQEYRPGTVRAKLFGADRINERHPAARYRGAFTPVTV